MCDIDPDTGRGVYLPVGLEFGHFLGRFSDTEVPSALPENFSQQQPEIAGLKDSGLLQRGHANNHPSPRPRPISR